VAGSGMLLEEAWRRGWYFQLSRVSGTHEVLRRQRNSDSTLDPLWKRGAGDEGGGRGRGRREGHLISQ
jgi:hypothetical protein